MKKLIITSALIAFLGFTATTLLAQNPPHPNGGAAPTEDSQRVGKSPSGAPVGTADILLVTMAALYGAYRLSSRRKPEEA